MSLSPLLSDDLQALAANITDPGKLADFIASSLTTIGTPVKQEVLDTLDIRARMDALNRILIKELEVLELGSKIQSQVQSEVGKNQREYFLREQLKAIQKELGEGDDQAKEIDELREQDRRRRDAGGGARRKRCASSIGCRRCRSPRPNTPSRAPTSTGSWRCRGRSAPRTSSTCRKTKEVLDADHSGLEKVKDRVLEYLAVRKLNPDVKGPILCFLGPSGRRQDVAGASRSPTRSAASSCACRSAACATRRRSAAIAAPTSARCPGRSSRACAAPSRRTRCSSSTRSTSSGSDFRGDPASALLEVLDPEQNNTFRDHYLDVPFDLSEVLFLTTANVLDPIPPALRDRMEVLELAGYTEEEKLKIARRALDREAGRRTTG